MIITFCGHGQFEKTAKHEEEILAILKKIIGDVAAEFYLGGYGDFDALAYACCKKYQATHPRTSLLFISPYITPSYQKNHLEQVKNGYDGILYPEIEDKPLRFAIVYRNRWMVEKADVVVCGITHDWGGAYKTYQYARKKGKTIYNVAQADAENKKTVF